MVPVVEYTHTQGCAVTGGYVYRGRQVPAIYAHYVFADFCSGTIWMIPGASWPTRKGVPVRHGRCRSARSARTRTGELYVVDHAGAIYKFTTR